VIPDPGTLAVFALAAFLLAVVPGPAVLYIVAQSVHGGRRAGVVSAFGIASGGLVHVLAAVIGLSALLAASAEAFTAVKLLGAATSSGSESGRCSRRTTGSAAVARS